MALVVTQKFIDSLQTTIADLPTLINEFKRQHPQQITSEEILREFPTYLQNWLKSKVPLADNVVFLVTSLEEEVKLVKQLFASIRGELRNCVNIRNAEKRIIKEYLEEINDPDLVQRIRRLRGTTTDDPMLPHLSGGNTQYSRTNESQLRSNYTTPLRSNGVNITPSSSSSAFRPIVTPSQEIPLRLPFRSSGPPQAADSYQGLEDTSDNDEFDERLPNTTPRGIVTNRVVYGTRDPNVRLPQLRRTSGFVQPPVNATRPTAIAAPTGANNVNVDTRQRLTGRRQQQTRPEPMSLTPILESEIEMPRLTTPELVRNDSTAILRLSPPRLIEGTLPIQPITDNLTDPSTSRQAREREAALRRVVTRNRDAPTRAPSAQSIAASSFARELEDEQRYRHRSRTAMDTDRESPFRSVSEARDLPSRMDRQSVRIRSPIRSRSNSSRSASSSSDSEDSDSRATRRSRLDVTNTAKSKASDGSRRTKSKSSRDGSRNRRSRTRSSRRSESPEGNVANQGTGSVMGSSVTGTATSKHTDVTNKGAVTETKNDNVDTNDNDGNGNDEGNAGTSPKGTVETSKATNDTGASSISGSSASARKKLLDEPEVQRLIAYYKNERQRLDKLLRECESAAEEDRESLIKRIDDITKEAELARNDAETLQNNMVEAQRQANKYRRELEEKRERVDAAVNSVHKNLSVLYGKPVANLDDVFAAVRKIINDLSASKETLTEFPKMLERLLKMNERDERDRERLTKMQAELVTLRADLANKNAVIEEAEENLKVYTARLNAKIEEVQRLESLSSDQADSLEQISANSLDLGLYKRQNQELRETIDRVKAYVQKKEKLVRNLERNYLESVDNIIRNIIGALRLFSSYHYIHERYQKASKELTTYVAETFTPIVQQEPMTSLNKTLDMIALDMIRDVSKLRVRETLPSFYKEILANVENQMPEYNQESEKEYFRIFIHTLREVIMDALNLRTDGSFLLSDKENVANRLEFEGIREQDYNAAIYGPDSEDISNLRSEAFKDLGLNEDDFKPLMPRNQYAFDSRPPTVFESTSRLFLQMGDIDNSLMIPDTGIAQPATGTIDLTGSSQSNVPALPSTSSAQLAIQGPPSVPSPITATVPLPQQEMQTEPIPQQQPQQEPQQQQQQLPLQPAPEPEPVPAAARSPINIIENVMIVPPSTGAQSQTQQQPSLPPIPSTLSTPQQVQQQQQELQNQLMREQLAEIERQQQRPQLPIQSGTSQPAPYEMSTSSSSSSSSSSSDSDSDITSTRSSVISHRSRVKTSNRPSPARSQASIIQPSKISLPPAPAAAPAELNRSNESLFPLTPPYDQSSLPPRTPRVLEEPPADDSNATRQTEVFSPYLWGDDSTLSTFPTPRTPRVDWSLELLQAEYGADALQQPPAQMPENVPAPAQVPESVPAPVQVPENVPAPAQAPEIVPPQQPLQAPSQPEIMPSQPIQTAQSTPIVQEQDLQPQVTADLPSPSSSAATTTPSTGTTDSGNRSKVYEAGAAALSALKSGAKKMNRVDGEVIKQQKTFNQKRREESRNNALNAARSFDFDAVITSEDDQINATLQLTEPKTLGQFITQMLKNEKINPRTLFSAETQQRILDATQLLVQFPQNPIIIQAAANAVVQSISAVRNPLFDAMDFDKSLNLDIFSAPLITVIVYMFWILYPHLLASDYVNHIQYIGNLTTQKPFINIPRFAPPMIGMDEPTAKAGAERIRNTLKELSSQFISSLSQPVAPNTTPTPAQMSPSQPNIAPASQLPIDRADDDSVMEFNVQPVVPIVPVTVNLLPPQSDAQASVAGSQQSYQQQQLTELQTQQQQNPVPEPTLESQLMPIDTDSKVPKLKERDTVSDSRELVQRTPRRKPAKQTATGAIARTGTRAPRQSATAEKTGIKASEGKTATAPTTKTTQRARQSK